MRRENGGKQLVFSIRKSAGRGALSQIAEVWIIGINETWSRSVDSVYYYPDMRDRGAPLPPESPVTGTDYFMAGAAIALALIVLGFIAIHHGKGPS